MKGAYLHNQDPLRHTITKQISLYLMRFAPELNSQYEISYIV